MTSAPRDDAASPATKAYQPARESDERDYGSFDRTILTKSANEMSMGKLGKYEVIELIGQGGMPKMP